MLGYGTSPSIKLVATATAFELDLRCLNLASHRAHKLRGAVVGLYQRLQACSPEGLKLCFAHHTSPREGLGKHR